MGKYSTTSTSEEGFPGRFIEPLLYVIAMIPKTTVFGQTELGYQTSKSAANISHLLYMNNLKLYGKSSNGLESLLNTVWIFSTDISMEFGLKKCATVTILKGKATHTEWLTLSNNNTIKWLILEESYKYLGVLQVENVKHRQVKKQTSTGYTNRVPKILTSKVNGGNTIQAINNWAVPGSGTQRA